jgi:hypothetical protein
LAGIIAILLGGILIFFKFPKHAEEKQLLAKYNELDNNPD